MAVRVFNKISPAIWWSDGFCRLSDKGKIGYIYFLTNGHVSSAGVYVLPDGYACSDLGWEPETYQAIRAEIMAAKLIDFDPDHSTLLVEDWFRDNPLMNAKHSKGTARFVAEIKSGRLRAKAEAALMKADEARLARQAARERETEDAARLAYLRSIGSSNTGPNERLMLTDHMPGRRAK